MSRPLRPRRAILFTPATDRRKVEKAAQLDADSVVIDLEDGVSKSRKGEAREFAARALAEIDFGRSERLVRPNALSSGLCELDLRAAAMSARPPDGFVLPKVESQDEIERASHLLHELETERGLAPGTFGLLAIIETARGIVHLREIAAASRRLEALIFGAEDLCGDTGAVRTRGGREVFVARSLLVLHAAAERLQAIDMIFVTLDDQAGLVAETREALELGYTGKLAIHPRQVAPIAAVFTPSAAEVAGARRLLEEHERHEAEGRGVFAFEGKMVDMPMIRAARHVIARARSAGMIDQPETS